MLVPIGDGCFSLHHVVNSSMSIEEKCQLITLIDFPFLTCFYSGQQYIHLKGTFHLLVDV
jgi:hypothetical protein